MTEQEQITHQLSLLETHRQTLGYYLERQAKLTTTHTTPDIFHGIREARENISRIKAILRGWGEIVEDLPDDDSVPPATSASASEQASLGLTAMADLISAPDVRARVEVFQDSFGIACRQIDRLSNYKDLHDLLHDLQFNCYNPIMRGARDFPENTLFLESLEDYAAELQQIINSLWEVTERSVFSTNEQAWIRQFSPTTDLLREAIEKSSKVLLDRVTFQIGRVLYVHPTRINERLKEAARELPLPKLIEAMVFVRQYSAHSDIDTDKLRQVGQGIAALELPHSDIDTDKLRQVRQGIAALELLSRSLAQMIDEHDVWQEIELELQRIEEGVEQHLQELEWLWPDLKARLTPLCHERNDRWTQELWQAGEKLERVLATPTPTAAAAAFRPFRRQAGLCFFQADKKLKDLCRSLRRVDGPLNSVLRVLA
jgi:hypothetical protein